MSKRKFVYCDSCVFLAYLKRDKGRIETLEQLFDAVQKNNNEKFVTSQISIVEVAFIAEERARNEFELESIESLDNLWKDTSLVDVVDFHETIAKHARDLIRHYKILGRSLKPLDAIHLATAKYLRAEHELDISEFLTYDKPLLNLPHNDVVKFDILEPSFDGQLHLPE